MSQCEICGKKTDKLFDVLIAKSKLRVCDKCKKLGTIVKIDRTNTPKTTNYIKKKRKENEKVTIIENVESIIKKELSKSGLNIKQLARQINIKDTTLNKMLNKKIEIDLKTIQKLEEFFKIKLTKNKEKEKEKKNKEEFNPEELIIEEDTEKEIETGQSLGDLIKNLKFNNKN